MSWGEFGAVLELSLLLLLRPPVPRYGEAAVVKSARHVFGVDFILLSETAGLIIDFLTPRVGSCDAHT